MSDAYTDDSNAKRGWMTPEEGTPPAPEEHAQAKGWKVSALPQDMAEVPDTPGGWHRPRPADTTLTPSDETILIVLPGDAETAPPDATPVAPEDLPPVLSPEDALQTLPGDEPETAVESAEVYDSAPLSPEDALSMVALMGDDEEEEEAGVRTELLALDMLAGAEAPADTTEEAPAAEHAEDPAEVARRKLAELESASRAGGTTYLAPEAEPGAAQQAPSLSSAEMRREELARRFATKQEEIAHLRTLYQQNTITPEQFEAELQARMILDDDQIWWRMGADDAQWYKFVDEQWVPAIPPLPQSARAALSTDRFSPDVYDSTLPYLSDSGAQVEVSTPGDTVMSAGFTPAPSAAPTDLDSTIVGPAAYRETLDAGVTQPGATLRSEVSSLGYGSSTSIESAVDETVPPQIDAVPIGELAQQAQLRQRSAAARNAVLILVAAIALFLIAGALILFLANGWYSGIVSTYEPQIAGLAAYAPEFQTVVIQDAAGREIAQLSNSGDRRKVELNQINPYLIHAVISTRNPTFYTDPGWDTGKTISAWFSSLGGQAAEPQRTITQLVAENLVLAAQPRIGTPLDLVVVAGEMSQRYSKDFILGLFLNEFSFGNNSFGAEAAARFYFDKAAADLNLPEAALLAAIMENPTGIDPVTNPGIIKPAIENVFARMAAVGCLDIPGRGRTCVSQADFNTPQVIRQKANVELARYEPRALVTRYPHFVNLVRQQLEAVYGQELYRRGFVVRTTLESTAQNLAEDLLRARLQELSGTGITVGAVMWTDPATGAVRAYVGSPDYDDPFIQGQRDYAREYLQPGGAIAPIVYATAFEGVDRNGNGSIDFGDYTTAGHLAWDVPAQYPGTSTQPPFSPQNINGAYYGPVTVREALVNQLAPATTRIYQEYGDAAFVAMAEKMGISFNSDAVFGLPTAVGNTPVRLRDLMTAYGTIASGGVRRRVYVISAITDSNGVTVELPEIIKPPEERVLSAQIAFLLQNILSDDLSRFTNLFPRNSALTLGGQPTQNFVAAVAATNQARTSLWTIGFTTNAVVGVWLGTPDSNVVFTNQTGFTAAAPLWNSVMRTMLAGISGQSQPRPFPDPGNMSVLAICAVTGTIYEQGVCPGPGRSEYFAQTRQPLPVALGPVVRVTINSWTRLRVSQYCNNPEDQIQATFLNTTDPFIIAYLQSPQGQPFAQRLGLTEVAPAPTAECDVNTQLPTLVLNPPATSPVQGNVQITGQVAGTANFSNWQIEVAALGSNVFELLPGFPTQADQPVPNSVLATWNTVGRPDGAYTVRLTAFSNENGRMIRSQTFNVDNPEPTPTPPPTQIPTPFPTFVPIETFPPVGTLPPAFTSQPTQPGFTPLPFDPLPTSTPDPF